MSLPSSITNNVGNNKTLEAEIAKAFLEAVKTCSSPSVLTFAIYLPGLTITFHELILILAIVACAFNCLTAVYLMCGHLYHWVKPEEQRQILRIILFIPVMSLCALFSIYFYRTQGYLHPIATYDEGFAITALFLLYVQYVCPHPNGRAQYFSNLERRWFNGKKKGTGGSLRWYRTVWICVFQITITRVATTIAAEALQGLTCPLSKIRSNGNIAIQVTQGVSTGVAVYGVIVFERRLHTELLEHHSLLKLISFKGVVALEATQGILFSVLANTGVYFPKPPYYVSWADFDVGIPEFVLVWEITIVAVIFLWGYPSVPYSDIVQAGNAPVVPTWKGFLSAFYAHDIGDGVKYMFTAFGKSTFLEGSQTGDVQTEEGMQGINIHNKRNVIRD